MAGADNNVCFFIRGTWGENPRPKPSDNIGADIKDTVLCYIRKTRICICLLDQIDYNTDIIDSDTTYSEGTYYAMRLMYDPNCDLSTTIDKIAEYNKMFAGRDYYVYQCEFDENYMIRQELTKSRQHILADWIENCIRLHQPTSVLVGGIHALVEQQLSIKSIVDKFDRATIDICLSTYHNGGQRGDSTIYTHVFGKSAGRGYCLYTTDRRRDLLKRRIDKQISRLAENATLYVFSASDERMMPRVHGPHLELLRAIITPEQAAIYVGGAPDDDAVTYDDIGDGIVGICDA